MRILQKIKRMSAVVLAAMLLSMPVCACRQAEDGVVSQSETLKPEVVDQVKIEGAKGQLSAEVYCPARKEGQKVRMVVLMHGFMSSRQDRIIASVATALKKKGLAYIRFDFNGHGESDGKFQDMTVENEVADAREVYEYAISLPFVSDVAFLGHSQGGVVASLLAGELGEKKVSRVVLMAPAAVLHDDAVKGCMFGVKFNPTEIPDYVDVFGHHVGRNYVKVAQKLNIYETAARYSGPVCIIHGKADEIVPYSYGERYKEVYKQAGLHLIEGDDHGFTHQLEEVQDLAVKFLSMKNKNKFVTLKKNQ